ncbi:MAG: chemotaxis protein CheA [Acidobacteriota bacterium]
MEDFNKEELDQLFAVFRDQSLQILDEMTQDLLALETLGGDAETLARLRRGAHTIKGDSACIDLHGVKEITHRIEDFLDVLIHQGGKFEAHAVDLILQALDEIKAAIATEDIQDVKPEVAQNLIAKLSNANLENAVAEIPLILADEGEPIHSEANADAKKMNGGKAKRDYVRVEAAKIDELLNLAGEMVIARSIINQMEPEIESNSRHHELYEQFNNANSQMGKLIGQFHKSVLKMRMVTIDQVFKRFARPMRELANETGKLVDLESVGGETELDRALVDLLYEPTLHLLRNAVDHGIESLEERKLTGKPEVAKINLRAFHEGNQVVVEVSDDGRGIDKDSIKKKVIEEGILNASEVEKLTEEEVLELIFHQGVSTAKAITHISGRGVGMSAVKASVEQLRGSISVKSESGLGTTFTLRMPLTLAIIRAMLFQSSGQLFALPLLSIREIARAEARSFLSLDGFETFRLRDEFISLVRPGVVLGFDRRKGGVGGGFRKIPDQYFIIVLNVGSKKYGIIADSLIGDQELVIKPLDSSWVQNEALAGASVLGDGKVALIMDAEMMFRKVIRYERSRSIEKRVNAG